MHELISGRPYSDFIVACQSKYTGCELVNHTSLAICEPCCVLLLVVVAILPKQHLILGRVTLPH